MNDLDLKEINESLKILADEIPSNLTEIADTLEGIVSNLIPLISQYKKILLYYPIFKNYRKRSLLF